MRTTDSIGMVNLQTANVSTQSAAWRVLGRGLTVSAIGLAMWAGLGAGYGGLSAATCLAQTGAKADDKATRGSDKLIMKRDGQVITGTIVSETSTTIRFRGEISGIAFETEYDKADILEIKRAPKVESKPESKPETKPEPAPVASATKLDAKPVGALSGEAAGPKVYVIELTGKFGRDISQTPIRDALRDAQRQNADVVVFAVDNDWSVHPELEEIEKGDDDAEFEQYGRADEMDMIFTEEVTSWDKPPRTVCWVKKAMGGAAFLPFVCKELYFSSDGKMGGIGNLGELLKGVGDDAVQEKQRSLRLARAEGMARAGEHPYEVLRAMAIRKYVLCASFEGGSVRYHERLPQNPGEVLLTDDGEGENADTQAAIAAGEGNDTLTLHAKLARDIGMSRGTADSLPDLMFAMGLPRTATVVKGRSPQIMKAWSEAVDKAERDIRRLIQEMSEVAPGNTYEERSKARGTQAKKLRDISAILDRYAEAFGKKLVAQYRASITDRLKAIDTEQQRDYQQNRKK